jgi:hypothetical protein
LETNIYVMHALAVLAALAAMLMSAPEIRGLPLKRRMILTSGVCAALSASAIIGYPYLATLLESQILLCGVATGLAGVVRGRFTQMQVNHDSHLILLSRAPDGFVGAAALLLLAVVDSAVDIKTRSNDPFAETIALAMVLIAGFLLGRSIMVLVHSRLLEHSDLIGPDAESTS